MTTDSDSTDDDGNVAAEYEDASEIRHRISPTTNPKFRNALRLFPRPVACWRIHQAFFHFDSSVILPEIASELTKLTPLALPDRRATIFGHADPVGSDEFNAHLSARRARALYGLLARNIDVWLDLFKPVDTDRWGLESTQIMLAALERQDAGGRYYTGTVDGVFGPLTNKATRAFQQDQGLAVDGVAGPVTRRRLYETYIDVLTGTPGLPLLQPDQFLGDPAGASDPNGRAKAAYQGCGEFNPVILMSAEDEARFAKDWDKTERNARNAHNRRAMIFFFRNQDFGSMSPADIAASWPCPAWNEGTAGCSKQFWANSSDRLARGDTERRYAAGEHTMACAWYDRFARLSPCEGRRRAPPLALVTDYPFSI